MDARSGGKVVSQAQESQSDTDSRMALHTPEVVIVNLGRPVLGREAFAEAMDRALASALGDVRTMLEVSMSVSQLRTSRS